MVAKPPKHEALDRFREERKKKTGSLDLSKLGLRELPGTVGSLTDLKALVLDHNRLTSLPGEIGKLSGLRVLSVSDNQLGAVPPEIWKLSGLTNLDLSDNQLSEVPEDIGRLTALTQLNLQNNNLKTLPRAIGHLPLETLSISGNPVSQRAPDRSKYGLGALLEYIRGDADEAPGGAPAATEGEVEATTAKLSGFIDGASPAPEGKVEGAVKPDAGVAAAPADTRAARDSIRAGSLCDQATADDKLGFKPYVQAVARFLRHSATEPPLTMSVEGEWGSGKSSFMRMLQNELDAPPADSDAGQTDDADGKPNEFVTVWFNPWRHDQEDSLWSAFALQCMRDIARHAGFWRRWIGGHVVLPFKRIDWSKGWWDITKFAFKLLVKCAIVVAIVILAIAYGPQVALWWVSGEGWQLVAKAVLGGAGSVAALGAAVWRLLRWVNRVWRAPLAGDLVKHLEAPDYASRIAFVEKFHADFQKILSSFLGDRQVAVFIDDLDRCEVPKAADLMQAINMLISDDPQIIFIIGMDRQKVAAGLAAKHERVLRYLPGYRRVEGEDQTNEQRGLEYGCDFIEKFIQVPFVLPTPTIDDIGGLLRHLSRAETGPRETAARARAGRKRAARAGRGKSARTKGRAKAGKQVSDSTGTTGESTTTPRETGTEEGNGAEVDLDNRARAIEQERLEHEKQLERRWRTVDLEEGRDSEQIHRICRLVAPSLGNNPRRIKQFLGLLRLRYYIAVRTGLFHFQEGTEAEPRLTREQLGKFIAITLRWPLLAAEIRRREGLLGELQAAALGEPAKGPDDRVQWWLDHEGLKCLLRGGCFKLAPDGTEVRDPKGKAIMEEPEQVRRHSLAGVDARRLLAVSAPPPGVLLTDEGEKDAGAAPEEASAGGASEGNASAGGATAGGAREPDAPATPAPGGAPESGALAAPVAGGARGSDAPPTPAPEVKTIDLDGGVTLELVKIPAGEFMMGSPESEKGHQTDEGPQHRVRIEKPFYMGKHPVTQAQWRAVMGDDDPSHFKGDNRPVEQVSWNDCRQFCDKLSEVADRRIRLPSEAEWEYACRAGTTTPFFFGETISTDQANYNVGGSASEDGSQGTRHNETTSVGSFPPNAFGLFDTHGNVWEWCEDVWHDDYTGAPSDGSAWVTGGDEGRRVFRGGSWYDSEIYLRSANRNWDTPDARDVHIGFRVAAGT